MKNISQLSNIIVTFFLGLAVGFIASQEYWYKKGAQDVIMMYEDFSSGIARNPDGRAVDVYFDQEKVIKNRELLQKINPELKAWYNSSKAIRNNNAADH